MAMTRLFRNGHSQAVRIPADLAYERADLELDRRADHSSQPGDDRSPLSALAGFGGRELVGVKGRAHGSPSLSSRSSASAEPSGPG